MSDLIPSMTLRSHAAGLARIHLYDWLILLALMVTDGLLNLIEPFHRFVGRDMMTDLRYPMKGNTVPFWAVPIVGIIGPILIITGIYFKKRNVYDFHHAVLGILYSVLITAVLTDAIKDGVGRPRPDFFWRCFPDGIAKYDNVTLGVICHGEKSVIKEGHKSFPSGHTSWSFAGLGFCSWYLAGKLKAFDRRGHVGKLCIVFAPLLLAAMVAISRVDDYWHHWQDVFTGGFLGLTVATICYLQFFPLPSDDSTFWPHAYHSEILNLQSSNGNVRTVRRNPFTVNNVEMETTVFSSPPSTSQYDERDTNPILEDMEAGRRNN